MTSHADGDGETGECLESIRQDTLGPVVIRSMVIGGQVENMVSQEWR